MLRLNLGCGEDLLSEDEGWINIDNDPDTRGAEYYDATNLPFLGEVDHVLAKHLLEHFDITKSVKVLEHWRGTLKDGGTIEIVVPDLMVACEKMVSDGPTANYGEQWWKTPYHMIYGSHGDGMPHRSGYSFEALRAVLSASGFHDIVVERVTDVWCPSLWASAKKPFRGCVDIVIPCWNQVEYTDRLLNSLMVTDHDFRLILIDNGSTDATANIMEFWKRQKPDTIIIKNDENLGFVKAVNQGLKASDSPFVMLLNNDTEIESKDKMWLDRMLAHFHEGVGAVGPTSTYVLGFQKNDFAGLPAHFETPVLSGFCVLYSREVIDKVGLMDERFGMGGNDDLDYCLRLADAGYKMVVARDVFIRHEGSISLLEYTAQKYDREPDAMLVDWLDQETREILVDKWGQERVDEMLSCFDEWQVGDTIHLA